MKVNQRKGALIQSPGQGCLSGYERPGAAGYGCVDHQRFRHSLPYRRAEGRLGFRVFGLDYVLEMRNNRFEGSGQSILTDPDVRRLYLGG